MKIYKATKNAIIISVDKVETINNIIKAIKNAKKIALVGHKSPDPDALASICTFHDYILKISDHKPDNIKLIVEDENKLEHNFNYFVNFDKVCLVENLNESVRDYDVVIFFDSSKLDRFTKHSFDYSNKKLVLIDHHNDSNTFEVDYSLSPNTNLGKAHSSNVEQLYEYFYKTHNFDKDFYETVLTGILTDTGSFTYLNHKNSISLNIAQEIIIKGKLSVKEIKLRYSTKSIESLNLFGKYMQTFKIEDAGEFGKISTVNLEKSVAEGYSYKTQKEALVLTKGFLDTPSETFISVYFRESINTINAVRMSFRSRPHNGKFVNVAEIAKHFSGGGHTQAAGSTIEAASVDEAKAIVLNFLRTTTPVYISI